MPKPLTITSTTNAHALWAYVAIAAIGAFFTFTEPPEAVVDLLSRQLGVALMGVLMFGGIACLSAALVGSKKRDPTTALSVEIWTLMALTLILLTFLVSLILFYGSAAPTTIVFTGAYFGGCLFRLAQASRERRLLVRARRQRDKRTVEVTAQPELE